MKIKDLLMVGPEALSIAATPEMDPFNEPDALQEAQLIGYSFDAVARKAGVIFELRTALQLREANTGVLVLEGVRQLSWSGPLVKDADFIAWTIGSSTPKAVGQDASLSLWMWPQPGAELHLVARVGAFFVGQVPTLGEVPVDYTASTSEQISNSVATWSSEFVPASAVYWGARGLR